MNQAHIIFPFKLFFNMSTEMTSGLDYPVNEIIVNQREPHLRHPFPSPFLSWIKQIFPIDHVLTRMAY